MDAVNQMRDIVSMRGTIYKNAEQSCTRRTPGPPVPFVSLSPFLLVAMGHLWWAGEAGMSLLDPSRPLRALVSTLGDSSPSRLKHYRALQINHEKKKQQQQEQSVLWAEGVEKDESEGGEEVRQRVKIYSVDAFLSRVPEASGSAPRLSVAINSFRFN